MLVVLVPNTMDNEGNRDNASTELKPRSSNDRVVYDVKPDDVLFGRGALKNGHPGNVKYRQMVHNRKAEYNASTRHREKNFIAQEIINQITVENNGRFLREVRTSAEAKVYGVEGRIQAWIIESAAAVNAKVKQALREGGTAISGAAVQDSDVTESDGESKAGLNNHAAVFERESNLPLVQLRQLGSPRINHQLSLEDRLTAVTPAVSTSSNDARSRLVTALGTLESEHLAAIHQRRNSEILAQIASFPNMERRGSGVPLTTPRFDVPSDFADMELSNSSTIDQLQALQERIANEIVFRRVLQMALPQTQNQIISNDQAMIASQIDDSGQVARLRSEVEAPCDVSSNLNVNTITTSRKRKISTADHYRIAMPNPDHMKSSPRKKSNETEEDKPSV
jgi:hypothetical protein